MPIPLFVSAFTGLGKPGDFEWEIQTQYRGKSALYIFNDNVADHRTCFPGAGNAVIRGWNRYGFRKTRAAGVSTGWSGRHGGFQKLTDDVRKIIDADLLEIRDLLALGEHTEVVYSADPRNSDVLGTGTFHVEAAVITYVVSQLRLLTSRIRIGAGGKTGYNREFKQIRKRFLSQHGKAIRASLWECFHGAVVLKETTVNPAIEASFVRCHRQYCATMNASNLSPALHGTKTSNYPSIFEHGLLIPGCGNEIQVAHGSAFGLGVYTAKLRNASLSREFCPQTSMLVCGVIDDTRCVPLVDAKNAMQERTGTSYPIQLRNVRPKRHKCKGFVDYVEREEVWGEEDPYACDIWASEIDPWSGRYLDNLDVSGSGTDNSNTVMNKTGCNVKYVLDSMVIFDPSHVVPLFVATRPGLTRWPDQSYRDDWPVDDPDTINLPLFRVWDWKRLKMVTCVSDRLVRRGWRGQKKIGCRRHRKVPEDRKAQEQLGSCSETIAAKRRGRAASNAYSQQNRDSNKTLSTSHSDPSTMPRPVQLFAARKQVTSRSGRARGANLKIELRAELPEALHEARVNILAQNNFFDRSKAY